MIIKLLAPKTILSVAVSLIGRQAERVIKEWDPEEDDHYFRTVTREVVLWSEELEPTNTFDIPFPPASVHAVRVAVLIEGCPLFSVDVSPSPGETSISVLAVGEVVYG